MPSEIVQGTRTMAEQQAIYDRSRTEPERRRGVRPGNSYHNYGLAFDIVPTAYKTLKHWNPTGEYWERLGRIGESLGLEWGGRWSDPDSPHFQIPRGMAPLGELKAYWGKFKRVMPITITPTTGGAAMILLVVLAGWFFYRWAGRIV